MSLNPLTWRHSLETILHTDKHMENQPHSYFQLLIIEMFSKEFGLTQREVCPLSSASGINLCPIWKDCLWVGPRMDTLDTAWDWRFQKDQPGNLGWGLVSTYGLSSTVWALIHAYIVKPQWKLWTLMLRWASPVARTPYVHGDACRERHPNSMDRIREAAHLEPSHTLSAASLPLILICLLFLK